MDFKILKYWISEAGSGVRHTGTPVLSYDLWGFNSQHRATIKIYLIAEAASGQTQKHTSFDV